MPAALEFPLRAPRRLTLESGAIINRGLRDLAPKYIESSKVAASLLKQISENRLDSLSSANMFMAFAGPEAERLSSTFQSISALSISAPLIGSMIERLYTFTGRTALAIVAAMDPMPTDQMTQFARALVAHDNQLELILAKDLSSRAKDAETLIGKDHRLDRQAIIFEEKGGKFGQLAVEEPTIRLQIKKWQTAISTPIGRETRPENRTPIETQPGFGAGAIIISDEMSGVSQRSKSLYFAATSLILPDYLSLDLIAQWKQATDAWLNHLGLPPSSLKRIYISAPYLAISAFLGQAFTSTERNSPLLMYPDQIYGWQPLLTLLAMLRQPSLPALFVHIGAGPAVQVAAVWTAP